MSEFTSAPCPHGRSSWASCPHCRSLNRLPVEPAPRRYSFTRDQLIAALLRLGYRRFVPAEPMADAIITALDATERQRAWRQSLRSPVVSDD